MSQVNLLHLADELLLLILNALQSRNDLFSLMKVCRRLSSIAEPLLYTSVLLRDIQDCASFVNSLSRHSERAFQIRSLVLDFAAHEAFEPVSVIPLLASMANLEQLSINSSDEENDAFDEIFNRALAPALSTNLLWSLRSCTLRYWNEYGEFWNLSNKMAVFLHPTLQYLTIFNAQADQWAMQDLHKHEDSTALEELHFFKCDIHSQSLADILALPRALKCLTIGQADGYHTMENSPLDVNDYVGAMTNQYDYLETLAILRETEFRHSPLKLEKLSALRRLEIDHRVIFTPLNTAARIHEVARAIPSILPSRLEELVLLDVQEGNSKSLVYLLQAVLEKKAQEKIVPALQRITFRTVGHLQLTPWFLKAADQVHVDIKKSGLS